MKFLFLLLSFLFVVKVSASEEEFAIWSSAEITTAEISGIGKFRIFAKADGARIASLTILAFGNTHTVAGEDLKKISAFPLSSMRITHEAGYEALGGYTVHLTFRRSYYDSDKKLRDDTAVISVSQKKGLMGVDIQKTK